MNLKLHPTALRVEPGTKKLLKLTRSYMRQGGFHVQYNIVDTKVLRDAQKNPQNYRTLMVRVAGFREILFISILMYAKTLWKCQNAETAVFSKIRMNRLQNV